MNLNDLSAAELAQIDSVCLEFESALRQGDDSAAGPQAVDRFVRDQPAKIADLLRDELIAVRDEVQSELARQRDLPLPFAGDSGGSSTETPARGSSSSPGKSWGVTIGPRDAQSSAEDSSAASTSGPDEVETAEFLVRDGAARIRSDSQPDSQLPESESMETVGELSGVQIGPYRLRDVIGKGGMGVVYRAIDSRLERSVAIKLLSVRGQFRQDLTERFEREAKAVAALSHPNIVELFDVGVIDKTPYAVMEMLEGVTLHRYLSKTRMTPGEVRLVGAQIADALAAAHAGGVIHRDLKPQNVMLARRHGGEGSAHLRTDRKAIQEALRLTEQATSAESSSGSLGIKLFDFGLSRVPRIESLGGTGAETVPGNSLRNDATGHANCLAESSTAAAPEGSSVDEALDFGAADDSATRAGVIMGTPGYMAPEQARGTQVCPATDMFSLGCVLHEAFYGVGAFSGDTAEEKLGAVFDQEPVCIPEIEATDPELAELIRQCLHKNAVQRPHSASEFAIELRRGLAQGPSGPSVIIDRRTFVESIAGGVVGAVTGGWRLAGNDLTLQAIRSLGFTTFENRSSPTKHRDGAIGGRLADRGELLASTLSHALAPLSAVAIRRYTPIRGETRADYQRIAKLLDVDALVTGDYEPVVNGSKRYLDISVAIVSAKTGRKLWGQRFLTTATDDLLEQSEFASNVATAIGLNLNNPNKALFAGHEASFACVLKGKAYSDPDSIDGLARALQCFQHAKSLNPASPAPFAGEALASITLAAQSDDERADELIAEAQLAISAAIKLAPETLDARLAEAMLNWQRLETYGAAFSFLQSATMSEPNHWQAHHQFGLLNLAMGSDSQGVSYVRKASKLHAMSVLLKTDLARSVWFHRGDEPAITQATAVFGRYPESTLATGLLIDLFEQTQDFYAAAGLQSGFDASRKISSDAYYAKRLKSVDTIPYGPFGRTMNRAIFSERRTDAPPTQSPELRLATLRDIHPLSMVLLLARHPALAELRALRSATELLPSPR